MPDEKSLTYINVTARIEKGQGERFKRISKAERYPYGELLTILMDRFKSRSGGEKSLEPVLNPTNIKLTIRIEEEQGERFKRMSKADRYPYGQFLTILMDQFEGK